MLSDKLVRKNRVKTTVKTTLINLENVSLDDLIIQLFTIVDDEDMKNLLKRYEKIILLAKVDSEKFSKSLYKFFQENSYEIKRKNLYRKFYDFKLEMDTTYRLADLNINIFNAYFSLLMEQGEFLQPMGRTTCGVDSKGKPLTIPEPYLRIDYPLVEHSHLSGEEFVNAIAKTSKQYGYKLDDYIMEDFNSAANQQKYISHMFSYMIPFINEETYDILPYPFAKLPQTISYGTATRQWMDNKEYSELLLSRSYILPKAGVKALIKNVPDVDSILLMETTVNNLPYLLYKVELQKGKYISGYYDINNKIFISPWELELFNRLNVISHSIIENLVLEIYSLLVIDFDNEIIKSDREKAIIVDDIKMAMEIGDIPIVQFMYKGKNTKDNDKNKPSSFTVHYDKSKYIEIQKNINYYIRKLPLGASASEEAKALAREYGYTLKPNETFVKPFTKKVHHKI